MVLTLQIAKAIFNLSHIISQVSMNIIFVDGRAKTCKEIKNALINKNSSWKEFAVGFPSDDSTL